MVTEVANGDELSCMTTFGPLGPIILDVIRYPVLWPQIWPWRWPWKCVLCLFLEPACPTWPYIVFLANSESDPESVAEYVAIFTHVVIKYNCHNKTNKKSTGVVTYPFLSQERAKVNCSRLQHGFETEFWELSFRELRNWETEKLRESSFVVLAERKLHRNLYEFPTSSITKCIQI